MHYPVGRWLDDKATPNYGCLSSAIDATARVVPE